MNADDWEGHKNLIVEDGDGGLKFKRDSVDQAFNYFCILKKTPLERGCKYQMTVDSIYDSDRFLDWGIVTKSKYDTIKTGNYMNSFSSGGIGFCGYSKSGGMSGT